MCQNYNLIDYFALKSAFNVKKMCQNYNLIDYFVLKNAFNKKKCTLINLFVV